VLRAGTFRLHCSSARCSPNHPLAPYAAQQCHFCVDITTRSGTKGAVAMEVLFDDAIAPRTSAVGHASLHSCSVRPALEPVALRVSSDMEAAGRPHCRDGPAQGPLLRTTLGNASKACVPNPCSFGGAAMTQWPTRFRGAQSLLPECSGGRRHFVIEPSAQS
jgi:hypothetical protein